MNTKIKILVTLLLLIFSGFAAPMSFATSAFGLNTIAGHTTVLRTSELAPRTDVTFEVSRPDGSVFNLPARTNDNGVALKEVSDYHTRLAGQYGVRVKVGNVSSQSFRPFYVYPNRVSIEKSDLTPSDQVVNTSTGNAKFRVRLVDDYNNPIEGHRVKLISSSPGSVVKDLSDTGRTNNRGEIEFEASSNVSGKITYSAYDATSDVVLGSKARVAYMGTGSDILRDSLFTSVLANTGNPSGPVSKFEFTDVPTRINVGDDITLTLGAYDALDQKVTTYTGTVRFAVTSDNSAYASLPGDYQFISTDQGEHTFGLAFSFLREGTYELEVRDINNPTLGGAVSLEVSSVTVAPLDDDIVITSPSSNTTYSTNIQVVSGTAPPGANLRILNNDVRIGETVADSAGNFTFTTGRLSDGPHSLYVASVNEVGTIIDTSSTVNFSIKTTAATIERITIDPPGEISAGEIIKVTLVPTDPLSRATMLLAGNVYVLSAAPGGVYEASVPAPIEFGEYPISFTLTDTLGNEETFRDEVVLKVGPSAPPEIERPGPVPDLRAIPGDGRITLEWSPPETGADKVVHYRVFHGPAPHQLTDAIDTFTDATTWYVPNLVNGETYYFAVAAVNVRGAMSESFDTVLPAIPTPPVVYVEPPPDPEEEKTALEELEEDVSEVGPEMSWLILLALFGGVLYSKFTKKHFSNCYRK